MDLLERLVNIIDCMYISNLHFQFTLTKEQEQLLMGIAVDSYSLQEWQETIDYITGQKNQIDSVKDAKKILLKYYLG